MALQSVADDISVFKEAMIDENAMMQMDAVRRLPALASAIGVERTKTELLPCLSDSIDSMHDEVLYDLSAQLERFLPLVGGSDQARTLLEILIKLSTIDETCVRDRAVEALKAICNDLDNQQCEKSFFPLIENLINNVWFTGKCSAAPLFAACYPKMSTEKQDELRHIFRNLIQDESPMVRRAAENGLVDFIEVLDIDHIKSEFVPVFDNLSMDEQDSVRVLAVDVGIAIAKKIKDYLDEYYLLKTFRTLSADNSWRVRQKIAYKVHEIQKAVLAGPEKSRHEILVMYQNCVRDVETEVRAVAANNLYNYCQALRESYNDQDNFEKIFGENIMSQIHYMITDGSDEVRLGLSTNILSLSTILRNECFNANILPLVLEALESEESMPFKENMLKNLNALPLDVDITKSFKSISKVVKNLLENSKLHWRTRRNVLVAFAHITKNSSPTFFDENLKIFYVHLLSDPVFAIRRTSSLILPLLVKQFGFNWANMSLIPIILHLSKDPRYLFRHVALFGINELIFPTLDLNENNNKYLVDLKNSTSPTANRTIAKIFELKNRLKTELDAFPNDEDMDYPTSDLHIYAEDTLETLKNNQTQQLFGADDKTTCYLEAVLLILIKDCVDILQELLQDPSENVRDRANIVLGNVRKFCRLIEEDGKDWVDERLKLLSEEEMATVMSEVDEELKKDETIDEEMLDLGLNNKESLPDLVAEIPELEVEGQSGKTEEIQDEKAEAQEEVEVEGEKAETST